MGVNLRDIIVPFREKVSLSEISGIVAIDAFNALYQFLSIIRQPDGTPLMDNSGRITSHLSGLFFRTTSLLALGIRPVYIFDGMPPALKADTIEERRSVREDAMVMWEQARREGDVKAAYIYARASSKIDAEILGSAKRLIQLLGIPVIDAPSEGEAQAAYMGTKGDITSVASQDYDTLLFGAPIVIRNLTISGKRKIQGKNVTVSPERISLQAVLDGNAITREELIQVAILTGTDFNSGVHGVGAKTGLKKVKKGEFESVLKEKMPEFEPEPVIDFFMHPPVSDAYTLTWKNPDYDGLIACLSDDYGFSRDRIESVLIPLCGKGEQKKLDSWF